MVSVLVFPIFTLFLLSTHPNFSHPSGRIALVYQSFCSHAIADQLYYDWIVEQNLVLMRLVSRPNFSQQTSRFALIYKLFCSRTIADRL